MTLRYLAACIQVDQPNPKDRTEIPGRVAKAIGLIERAVVGYGPFGDVRLIVFPEFFHAAPVYPTIGELHEKLAVELPGKVLEPYLAKARELGVWIQTGTFLERDPRWLGHVFNTTCLVGPQGLLYRYRKVHPWLPWEVHTSPHDLLDQGYSEPLWPVADTPIGKLGCAICYDWLFPEALRALAMGGAEVLIRVSAYMDPWGATPPMDWWTVVNRCRALENMAYVVAANQAASLENYPPFSWPGGSMVVDFDGRIVVQADPGSGDKIVVGPVDIAALRHERQRRAGHLMQRHLRPEAYK